MQEALVATTLHGGAPAAAEAEAAEAPASDLSEAAAELHLLRSENAELRTLLALQGDLARGLTPREIFQEVAEQIHVTLGCDHSYALLWQGERRHFVPAASAGLGETAVAALKRLDWDPDRVHALERAFRDESVLRIEDAAASPLIPPEVAAELGMGALLLAPIRGVDRAPIGVLLFDFRLERAPGQPSSQPSPLTPERQRLAGAVAGQLALLLENALLYEQLRRRTSRLEALNEIGLGLAAHASDEPAGLFRQLYPSVAEVVDGAGCILALLDERARTMTGWAARDGQFLPALPAVPVGEDIVSLALRGKQRTTYATREAIEAAGGLPAALAGKFDALSSAICLPLRMRRRTFGALAVVSPHAHAFTTEQVEFLTTVAAQAAVTLEHGRLYTLLRTKGEVRGRLLDQTLQAQENERKHLVEGILDGALQELASCTYRLDLCARLAELGQHERSRDELRETRRQLAERIESLREVVGGLRPSSLDHLGLQSVLRDELTALRAEMGVQTEFRAGFKERLAGPVETRAYRIVQELLTNIRRHAEAKSVTVELQERGDEVVLAVSDDGRGFDAAAALSRHVGMGLHAIREQAELLGGTVRVQSRPGFGTRVEVVLPREASGQREEES